jgi:hypothetical protein
MITFSFVTWRLLLSIVVGWGVLHLLHARHMKAPKRLRVLPLSQFESFSCGIVRGQSPGGLPNNDDFLFSLALQHEAPADKAGQRRRKHGDA